MKETSTIFQCFKSKVSERKAAWAMLAVLLAAAFFSTGRLSGLTNQYSIEQFLPQNHPLLKADSELRDQFDIDHFQPILVTLERDEKNAGDWFASEPLRQLEGASQDLQKIEDVSSVISLGTVQVSSPNGDEVRTGSLMEFSSVEERRQRVLRDRMLSPSLISADGRKAMIVMSLKGEVTGDRLQAVLDESRNILKQKVGDAKVSFGGPVAIQFELSSLLQSEVLRFMVFALLAACLAMLSVFSSLMAIVTAILAICTANIFVLAFMAVVGIPMTVLSVTVPILVSVTVLSLCLHTMLRFAESWHGEDRQSLGVWSIKAECVLRTMRALFLPNLLTSLTTAFGFATLIAAKVPLIHEFGVAVSASVLISWLSTTLLMVPVLILVPVPRVRAWVLREATWAGWVLRQRRSVLFGVGLACLAMVSVGTELSWSGRLFDDLPANEEARIATEQIDGALGGSVPLEVVIRTKQSDFWNDPQALNELDLILARARSIPEVGSATGLPDLLRFAIGSPTSGLPQSRAAIAENWFVLSVAESSPLRRFLTPDGSSTRLALRLRDVASDRQEAVVSRFKRSVHAAFPDAEVELGGMGATVHTLNNSLSLELMGGFWQALAVIAVLLFFVFKSWRWTLVAVVPNLVPAAMLIGLLALARTPIKPGVALVFSIALGIAFNNTVYLLQRLRDLMRENGSRPVQEIEKTLRLEGHPCLIASACLLAGFGVFVFSRFGINQTFGIYMLISLFFGLVGDLVFLPALIRAAPGILGSTVVSENQLKSEERAWPVEKPWPRATVADHGMPVAVVAVQEFTTEPELNFSDIKETSMTNTMTDNIANHERNPMEEFTEIVGGQALSLQRTAAILLAFMTLALVPERALADKATRAPADANTVLKLVQRGLTSKDESAWIKMRVIESNGAAKERELEIKRKSGGKSQVLVRLMAPTDVSGIGFLSIAEGAREDQWLYMPSQRKARRVLSGNKSQRFLDTEFNLEDFSASTYTHFDNKIVREDRQPSAALVIIESKARTPDTSYSKIMTWVDLATYQVQKADYYDPSGKLLKTMVFRDYKKFGQAWRAQTVEVRNMQNSRSTILKMANLRVDSGLTDREFTQTALESAD